MKKNGIVIFKIKYKTLIIKTWKISLHKKYQKQQKRIKYFIVHDEQNIANINDSVEIITKKPISKQKTWYLNKIKK